MAELFEVDELNHARRSSRIAYRADLDGLRAIAVIGVMLFHLQIRYVMGGFVAVDVFFVLSGFLITSIVLLEMDSGRFSLRAFYARRIRRIVPALFVAMAGTSVLALFFCLPAELREFARSLLAVSLSGSNIYFGLHSAYFDPLSLSRPALQTWSLGVEEQFYLCFPLLLIALRRFVPRRLLAATAVMAALSFAVSAYQALFEPTLAYFMPWSRAWELLVGALLAMGAVPRTSSRAVRNAAAGVGLLLVVGSMLVLNGAVPFPGAAALLPCGGAALLIWSGQPRHSPAGAPLPEPTVVARGMSVRPLVFVGLISYSLYLWHWPLIVFEGLGLWGVNLPHRVVKLLLVVGSLGLATLSWRYVERPFRDGPLRLSAGRAFGFAGATTAVLLVCGLVAIGSRGLPGRFPQGVSAVGEYVDEPLENRMGTCLVIRARDFRPDPCLREDPTRPNWLLFGDSHAATAWVGLRAVYPQVHFLQMARTACAPDPLRTSGDCGEMTHAMFAEYLPTHRVDRILLMARWDEADIPAIGRAIAWMQAHSIPVTLVGTDQDYDAPLPRLLALGLLRHDAGLADRHRIAGTAALDTEMQRLARTQWHVPYVSLWQMFCNRDGCIHYADAAQRTPLLVDDNHFTNEGSLLAAQRMAAGRLLAAPGE